MCMACRLSIAILPATIGVVVALLVLGSPRAALAVKADAPTVTCTEKCQKCLEVEVSPGGGERCVKCGIDPQCLGDTSDPGLTSDFTDIVKRHNEHRKEQCAGPLTWSPQIAATAQQWAKACTSNGKGGFAHQSGSGYGENLAWGGTLSGVGTVDMWYEEKDQYNFVKPAYSNAVGHFTQVVWKNSKEIGCGVARCGAQNFWVCRYSPPGNFNVDTPGELAANVGCAQPKAAKETSPAPSSGNGGKAVTVENDVDIYKEPGGQFEIFQCGNDPCFVGAGTSAQLLERHADGWCKLKGIAPGGADGWVAEDHIKGKSCQ